ncbi:MAG: protein translocase subunit SecF [Balneolaceae bacterium]
MRWFETPNFNFIDAHRIAYAVSGVLVLASIVAIFGLGLNYGIDFSGGKEYVFQFEQPVDPVETRLLLTEPLDAQPEVRLYGTDTDIMVRTDAEGDITVVRSTIETALTEAYPDNPYIVIKTDIVGPRFADDLRIAAMNSVFFALAVVFIYILIRFKKWYYSAGAVAALFHDVIVVLGVFTLLAEFAPFDVTINQAIIAAFLTIVGYSLNDTVVVFDRVRENSIVFKTMEFEKMINKSLNDTLSRTVITSVTTLFVVLVLFIFGGEVLKGFSFALVIGVILGTYSSLFIASALVVELERRANRVNS